MIASFKDSSLETFYFDGPGRRTRHIPSDIQSVLRRKLDQLYNANSLDDLRAPPANRLEALKGDLKGFYSIRVNQQWRLIFQFEGDTAYEISLVDYH